MKEDELYFVVAYLDIYIYTSVGLYILDEYKMW